MEGMTEQQDNICKFNQRGFCKFKERKLKLKNFSFLGVGKPTLKNTENKSKLSKLSKKPLKEVTKKKSPDSKLPVTKKHVKQLKLKPNLILINSKLIH